MIHCAACGAVNEADTERFQQMRQEIKELRGEKAHLTEQLGDAERDLRMKRAQISRLRGDRNSAYELDPYWDKAVECWDQWRVRLCPKAREFKGPRADATLARIRARDGENEDVLMAILGAEQRKYMVDGKRQAHGPPDRLAPPDLELICRNEANLMRFMSYAESSTMAELHPALSDPFLPDLLKQVCDCGHTRAEHIPTKLLAVAELELVGDRERNPCAHNDCGCFDYSEIHQRAEDWLSDHQARLRREQMRAA